MIKLVSKVFKWLLIAFAWLFLLFIAINLGDEELKPEVQTALKWQTPANIYNENGYLILLGIDAPLDQEVAQVGKQKYEAELARFKIVQSTHQEPPAKEHAIPSTFANWNEQKCIYHTQKNCVDFYLKQDRNKLTKILTSNDVLLKRYAAILQSKHYIEAIVPMVTAEIPSYSSLMNASELQRIQAILAVSENRTEQGMKQLIENSLFSRRLLEASNSLVSHMIALSMIKRDMQTISELLTKNPALAKTYQEQLSQVLASIDSPEFSTKKVFITERNMVLATYNFSNLFLEEVTDTAKWRYVITRFGYQPKATINLLYQWSEYRISLTEASANELESTKVLVEEKQKSLLGFGFGWFYFKNPAGKILASVAEPDYASYIERHHDTEGYIRLVKTQWHLLAENTPKENIAQVLAQNPNPYTLKPFALEAGMLKFIGHGKKYGESEAPIFQVQVVAVQ